MSRDIELWDWLMFHPASRAARGRWVDLNVFLGDLKSAVAATPQTPVQDEQP